MIFVAGGLALVVALCVVALYRQQVNHLTLVGTLLARAEWERRSLLDRIQHPTVRQVEQAAVPVEPEAYDAADYAHVGQLVPDGVHVGTPDGEPAPVIPVLDMIGTVV